MGPDLSSDLCPAEPEKVLTAVPGSRPRRASHAAIMKATIDLLTEVGYHRLTIEGVSAQAGVSKATVYRWWPTKARLVIDALAEVQIEPVEATGDLRADVRAMVEKAIEIFVDSPSHVLPEMRTDLAADPEARTRLIEVMGPARASHLGLLYSAAGRAELPHDIDANLILDVLAGTVVFHSLFGARPDAKLIDQMTDLIVESRLPRTRPLAR